MLFVALLHLATSLEPPQVPRLNLYPPRRVALLVEPTPFTHISGYSNRFKEMLRFLVAAGDEVTVITPDDTPERPRSFLGVPITYLPGFRLLFYKQVQLSLDSRRVALRALRSFRPSLFNVSALYSRLLSVPLVISYHTHLSVYAARYVTTPGLRWLAVKLADALLPRLLNCADLTLATSPQLQQQLRALGCRRVEVWRKGVDTLSFSPAFNASNAHARHVLTGGQPHRPLLLYVGRLGAEKRVELLRAVLDARPDATLAIVGGGPAEASLRREFAGAAAVFAGVLQGEDLSRAYAAADVFVMPSDSETLGFVVLEAMASGVPAVAADAGGLSSLVADGETGLLFTPGDGADLAAKVGRLIDDPRLRREMGRAACAEARRWSWEAATSVLRNKQYALAESRFRERQRWVEAKLEAWRSPLTRLRKRRPHRTRPSAAAFA